jgi:hypothetical protein
MQVHYRNDTDAPILREVWVNAVTVDPAAVKANVGSLGLIGGVGMQVAPHTTQVVTGSVAVPRDMRLLLLTGYFREHTKRLTAWRDSAGAQTLLLEQYDTMVSRPAYFDDAHENLPPDRTSKTPGGFNGPLELSLGDAITWECEVENDLDTNIGFGEAVHTAEMCNLFGTFAPGDGTAWFATSM